MMNKAIGQVATPVHSAYGKTVSDYHLPGPTKSTEIQLEQKEQLQQQLSLMNVQAANLVRSMRFNFLEETGEVVVEIVDLKTEEVLETIPPEYLIKLSIQLKEMLGLFLDRKL
jgi:flagellar protein FlaG